MSTLHSLIAAARRAEKYLENASDAEIARTIGDVCTEMLAESNKAGQREWNDEIMARAVARLRTKARVQ